MRQSSHRLGALEVVFDDRNAVANGGRVLPMTLADRLGLESWWTPMCTWAMPPGVPTLAKRPWPWWPRLWWAGDSIDDADVLRSGRAAELLAPGYRPLYAWARSCAALAGPTPAAWTRWRASC